MKKFVQFDFDFHRHAYIVVPDKKCFKFTVQYSELPVISPCLSLKKKNIHYIATKYTL